MESPVLLHISDLHFGKTHDSDVAKDLLDDLRGMDQKPNIVIVSGDLAWHGEKHSLQKAKTFLERVINECGIIDKNRLIVVPGNHDLGAIKRRLSIRWALANYVEFFETEPTRFFPDLGISIFGVNSNMLKISSLVADGKIGSKQRRRFRERYNSFRFADQTDQQARTASTKAFLESFKIAVVHHHLVPLPRATKENFNILRDAGDFLETLTHFNFDLILHGHQHYPFVCALEYRSRFKTQRKLLIVASGTSSSSRRDPPGYNQYAIISMSPGDARRPVSIKWRTHYGISFGPFHEPSFSYLLGEPEVAMNENILDEIAKSIGHKRLKFVSTTHINLDGTCVDETLVRVRSTIDGLRGVHVQLTSDPPQVPTVKLDTPYQDCEAVELDANPDAQGNHFINFKPYLKTGQEVEFRLVEQTSKPIFLMSREDLLVHRTRDDKWEYHEYVSHLVTIPLNYLEIKVVFPPGFDVTSSQYCRVHRDPAGTMHPTETERFEASFKKETDKDGQVVLFASITSPSIGLRYAVCWQPVKSQT